MLLCIVFLAAAPSASALEETISPGIGIGIGQVKLGMTAAQVKKRLGADYLVNGSETVGGRRYIDYAWDYARWVVTFGREGRSLRVVQVATNVHGRRTAKGVGLVRSPFEPLDEFGAKRQYRCSDDWRTTDSPEKVTA